MEPARQILKKIQEECASKSGPLIVGLSGIECSGKTTLAEKVANGLIQAKIPTYNISIDRFLNPKHIRYRGKNFSDAYNNNTFRISDIVNQLIDPIKRDASIDGKISVHDLASDKIYEESIALSHIDILIIDGVFLFRSPIIEKLDLKIWLDISFEKALARAQQRELEISRFSKDEITDRYRSRYFPAQREHIEKDKPAQYADMIIHV